MVIVPEAKSDCSYRGEAKVRIFNFKTTWSEFQRPSQTAPAEAKPRCVYSILKPHGQSFITSPESVQSSCVRQHTQDVSAQRVHPTIFYHDVRNIACVSSMIFLRKKGTPYITKSIYWYMEIGTNHIDQKRVDKGGLGLLGNKTEYLFNQLKRYSSSFTLCPFISNISF